MTKSFAREKVVVAILQIKGNLETPDTTPVTVVGKDSAGNVTASKGNTVPAGESGYALESEFVDLDKSAGTHKSYKNIGTTTVASWNLVGEIDAADLGSDIDGLGLVQESDGSLAVGITIYNNTGGTLVSGTLVKLDSFDGVNGVTVVGADANAAIPATHFVRADIANGASGIVYPQGESAADLNTLGQTIGDAVYLGTAGGGAFQFSAPGGDDHLSQLVGVVKVVDVAAGVIEFFPGSAIYLAFGSSFFQPGSVGVNQISSGLITDVMTLSLMGTAAAFGFPWNVMVNTPAGKLFAKIDDGGSFADLADSAAEGGYTGAFQLWPDTEAENDAVYFGNTTPFGVLNIDVSATVATYGANSIAWEYFDGGTWQPLTIIFDETGSTANDGERSFQVDGQIIFSAPGDWLNTTIDGQDAFWVRARIKAGFNVTQLPLLVDEHGIASSPTASEMPATGTISRARLSFQTVSGANNDTKIILCNLTKGTASVVSTLVQALVANEVANFAVDCDAGDQIAIYVTQEDGTTEFADGVMELLYTKA